MRSAKDSDSDDESVAPVVRDGIEVRPDAGGVSAAPEKRVGWAELFFDLVFVVAVTRVSALLEQDHGWAGLLRALVVFVPLYWTWVGVAVRTNQRDAEQLGLRLTMFTVALASIFMTMAVPHAYTGLGLVFAGAYWLGRIVLGAPMVRRSVRGPGVPVNPVTVSIVLTGPVLVVGAALGGTAQIALWAVAAVVDLSTPTVLRRRLRGMHFDPGHLVERFGLFVLIALGESVVAVGAAAGDDLDLTTGAVVVAAFVLVAGLWWVYFHFSHDAVRHALGAAAVQIDVTRLVLSYGHLMIIAGVVTVSVGLHEAVAHTHEPLGWGAVGLLYGGTALFLASFGYTRWAMFRLVSRTRLTAAAVVLVLMPLAPLVPPVVAVLLPALVVVALNVVELRIHHREGWRARAADEV